MQDDAPQMLQFKNPVSSKWDDPNFGALIIDNRDKGVEMIREVPDLKDAYSPRLKKSSEMSRSLFSSPSQKVLSKKSNSMCVTDYGTMLKNANALGKSNHGSKLFNS